MRKELANINISYTARYRYKVTEHTVPLSKWHIFRIIERYRAGIPMEFMAIVYGITLKEIELIIKYKSHIRAKRDDPGLLYRNWWRSIIFFYELGVPVHIMARLYHVDYDTMFDILVSNSYQAWRRRVMLEVFILYKDKAYKEYLTTEAGKERLAKIKKVLKWE